MDLTNLARILFTVFCFVAFIVILIGAFEKKSQRRYDDAANLVFNGDEEEQQGIDAVNGAKK
ncbi:cbb3-type cytochrome oxidase subunit 3 [Vogesella fluminis]|uniref:Cbb3-type cytochrome c oxidase subunit 3 n=1 Tax=Vogesella fluminis TaxID=1069161 RepID=A0ABQ3H9Y1_9NEIS|nr:cbb3-type cytochrome c oxidase subunit 3 [Vogesella fluminis]GHD71929.1 hypothetical protein GCM10011419_04330 [Vogesella fluminis]